MSKSPTRAQMHKAATEFLDADFDGYVFRVGREVGVIGVVRTLITLNTGNVRVEITLRNEEIDELVKALKAARKALR